MALLEDYVRLDEAAFMRISEAYFAARGKDAWALGEVPSYATSSPPAAARVANLVRTFARGRPVRVLEIGGGSGEFARNFLDAYQGELTYVWSDFSEQTLRDGLRGHLAGRTVIPALWDARRPSEIVGLDAPVDAGFDVVIANYVACVLPTRAFRLAEHWEEALVRVSSSVDGDLVARAGSEPGILHGLHVELTWDRCRDVPDAVAAAAGSRPIVWPAGFFRAMEGLGPLLRDGAVAVISDFGSVDTDADVTRDDILPRRFGNSIAFTVQFPSVALWAWARGWDFAGSCDPTEAVHTAIVSFGAPLAADLAAQVRALDGLSPAQSLLDFHVAADALRDARDFQHAARFYARCAQLAPDDIAFRLSAAAAYTDAGFSRQALVHLEVAARLVPGNPPTIYESARAWHRLGNWPLANERYEQHLALGETAETHYNLAMVAEATEDIARAVYHFEQALRLDPTCDAAAQIEQLREVYGDGGAVTPDRS